jgi:ElaB/YqjD/DUF883 family membrane-anchored ribosome-binding protein
MNTTTRKDEGNKAKDQATQAVDKGREAAGHAGEAVSHAASAVGQAVAQKAGDVASTIGQKASDFGHTIGQKAEDATSAVGGGMHTLADKVRDNAPNEGVIGSASRSVAGALDDAGKYVQDKNLSGMMDDVTGLVKRNPIPALLLGLGIGFLIGRALSSRS